MADVTQTYSSRSFFSTANVWGLFWFCVALVGAAIFFIDGTEALYHAWQLPEYSHGPLIPLLSGFLFLRQLKEYPPEPGPKHDRWVGVTVILGAIAFGTVGKLAGIADVVAYSTIIWVWGILLISFGWNTGKHFWPPVLHLVYMLPLPDTLYYKMSTYLQFVSSELGVRFLTLMSVPVFLDGNIIDLGVYKLHVAEACSGLRYLFPIMSFSYIFAVLYKGPMWHKAVLLISAAPIAVFMNSVRIGIAGLIVNNYGLDWIEGFSHFFEGWVIFVSCIIILFLLARIMLFFNDRSMSLAEALDLDTTGLGTEAARVALIQPSKAMITAAIMMMVAVAAWFSMPDRNAAGSISRESFYSFPKSIDGWSQYGRAEIFNEKIAQSLAADDYRSIYLTHPDEQASVGLFMAWYSDQSRNGVHSPEICLPGNGWEIASIKRVDIADEVGSATPFNINEVIIQKGESRSLVLYWFEQKGRRLAWDLGAKFMRVYDGVQTGRTDGGIVRLTTQILPNESDEDARARLIGIAAAAQDIIPRYMPH
jgi:exosortase D (VPLPA-CTERM-specific)